MKSPRTDANEQRKVGAIILAAGSSRRAGSINKLLAPYSGTTMVAHIAQSVCESQADQVVVVTGYEQNRIEDALSPIKVACHHNSAHTSGMASSVVTGVSQLIETDAVLICLADMPHVSTCVINQLIIAFKGNTNKSIFLPVSNTTRGNPVLFSRVFFENLLKLEGDVGAKMLVQQHPDEVYEVVLDDDRILVDYDTPAELNKLALQST
ncbi:MAG: nucleotidyltransferase family protein [Granulosicoccaceae bacterium]